MKRGGVHKKRDLVCSSLFSSPCLFLPRLRLTFKAPQTQRVLLLPEFLSYPHVSKEREEMRNSSFFPGNCGQGEKEKAVNEERGGLRCWEGGIPAYHDATEKGKGVSVRRSS